MLTDAVELCDGPASVRWPKTTAVSADDSEVGSGLSARLVREGSGDRVCLIGVGKMLAAATDAAEILALEGIEATVWDPRVVKPLDGDMLDDAARHDLVVTVEDGFREGGAGTGIETALRDRGSVGDVQVLGVPVTYIPHANPDVILERLGLDGPGVAASVRAALD